MRFLRRVGAALCALGIHFPRKTVKNTGIHLYLACTRCESRKVVRVGARGHQPVDTEWVRTGRWTTFTPPRGGASP